MARDIQVTGPILVKLLGGNHMSGGVYGKLSELGLSTEAIHITPHFFHKDINVDDFGPNIPAEIMYLLSEVNIRMSLIHYDKNVLDAAMEEAQAGSAGALFPGTLSPAGSLMGNGRAILSSGNHYTHLNLITNTLNRSWRFLSTYLADSVEIPIGTETTVAVLNWRAIPYRFMNASGEISSSGVVLFDNNPDTA